MGFFGKLFGKKGNNAAAAVGTVNTVVDQVQAAVPGTTGDAVIDKVQESVTNVAEQVSSAPTPDQSAAAPVADQPATPEVAAAPAPTAEGVQQPPQNPAV